MIRLLSRLLFLGVLVVLVLALFAPKYLEQAGNSLITAFNNSAATGLAQYIPSNVADKDNHLQVSVQGLSPNTKYEVTLDADNCNGSPMKDVGPVTSDGSGSVTAEFTLASLDTNRVWFVDIHQGPTSSGTTVACGRLEINKDSASQVSTPTTLDTNGDTFTLSLGSNTTTGSGSAQAPSTGSTPTTPKGFPQTGVNPGGKNSYKNTTYPRKF